MLAVIIWVDLLFTRNYDVIVLEAVKYEIGNYSSISILPRDYHVGLDSKRPPRHPLKETPPPLSGH